MTILHQFNGTKYTVVFHDSGQMEALRHGEPWQDLTGNGLILAMLQDYDDLKEQSEIDTQQIECLLNEVEYLRDKLSKITSICNGDDNIPILTKQMKDNFYILN